MLNALRGFLQLGFFIAVTGFCSAWFLPRDSGEFVVSICAGGIGLTLIIGIVILGRLIR